MSKAKLEAARELIREKHYDAARAVLETMPDDSTALKWLIRLDEITGAPTAKPAQGGKFPSGFSHRKSIETV